MKKVLRLTESDLVRLIKRIVNDQSFQKAIIYPNFQGADFADNVDGEVKIIKVNDCIGNEPGKDFNYFNTEKKDYVEKMIESAKEQGIKSFPPIKVLKHPLLSGKYIVVDGNHRLGAFKIGNIPEIKASILYEDDIVLAIPRTKWQEGKIPETISLKDAKSKGIDLKNYFNTEELNIPTSSLVNKLTESDLVRLVNKVKKGNKIFEQKSGKSYNIYLAGPNVFKKDAIEDLNKMKEISKKYNQIGNAPIDNEVDFTKVGAATRIFHGNIEMMDMCDVIIANLEPFRGPNVDDGTAFELGYGFSKNKIMYGYMTHSDRELKDITADLYGDDEKFPHIENFKYPRNLMIVDSIRSSGGNIFKTFEECVKHLVENH